jgi:hypothetical protein
LICCTTRWRKARTAIEPSRELIPVTKDNVDEFAENWKKWLPKK